MTDVERWSGPGRALEFHLDLFRRVNECHRWGQKNYGKSVAMNKVPDLLHQRMTLMLSHRPRFGKSRWEADDLVSESISHIRTEDELLNRAETHYVSHSVAASITLAAEKAEPEPIFPTDLPAKSGLIVLETPLMIPDVGDQQTMIPIRAIGWMEAEVAWVDSDGSEPYMKPGIAYVLYQTFHDLDAVIDMEATEFNIIPADKAEQLGVWPTDISAWSYGIKWVTSENEDLSVWASGSVVGPVSFIRRWILSYFRWTWQRIVVPTRYEPDRAAQRRIDRANFDLIDGYVKVMKLRRIVESGGHETWDGEYVSDHQWLVRGFWRRQWYKSLGPARLPDGSFNEESHRMVWVEPHIRGNPDGPLVVGYDVTSSVR